MAKNKLTDVQKLAELLHAIMCIYNHTDGCGWYYTTDRWTDFVSRPTEYSPFQQYFSKAEALIAACNNDREIVLKSLGALYGEKKVKEENKNIKF